MPGIIGIISKANRQKDVVDVQRMVNTMMHETFYSSGVYEDTQLGVSVGWITHQESFSDCMPVFNEKKNIAMIYHGENFTGKETYEQLKAKNHKFDNRNASYLVHLYEEHGIDFLKLLNGWFTGIIIDSVANRIVLFNDRFGMQRLFYYEGKDAFFFASEAKVLLKICPELKAIDMRGLGEHLSCDCVLENRTLFKNVYLLPGSAAWQFDQQGIITKHTYFNPEVWENQPWLESDFFYGKLKETFTKILPRYFRATQTVGISLTGGLNTRIIMANAALSGGKYPCYTFGGMYRDSYDVKIARKVASICQQEHATLTLDKAFLTDFAKYAEETVYFTDGYLNVCRAHEIYLNKKARDIAPVQMTGNYGGEVLRDISGRLKANLPMKDLFSPGLHRYFKEAVDTFAQTSSNARHPLTFNLFTEIPWLRNHDFVSAQSQVTPRTPYMDNELVSLMYRVPVETRNNRDSSLRLISDGNPALGAMPTDLGFGGKRTLLLSPLREQFLAFLLKAERAHNGDMPPWQAKTDCMFKPMHFERLFLGRHKLAHFRHWYREDLSDYVKAVLLDEKTLNRPHLNRKAIEKMIKKHATGCFDYTVEISKILTLELTHRLLIDR